MFIYPPKQTLINKTHFSCGCGKKAHSFTTKWSFPAHLSTRYVMKHNSLLTLAPGEKETQITVDYRIRLRLACSLNP